MNVYTFEQLRRMYLPLLRMHCGNLGYELGKAGIRYDGSKSTKPKVLTKTKVKQ